MSPSYRPYSESDRDPDPGGGAQADQRATRVMRVLRKFRVIFKSSQKHSRLVERQCGVSAVQLWALRELAGSPGLRVMDLAAVMSLHQSTASNLLDRLQGKGLVARERGADDQRVVRLFLTRDGQKVVQRAPQPVVSLLPDALHKLPDEVLAALDAAITRLVAELGVSEDEGVSPPLNWT